MKFQTTQSSKKAIEEYRRGEFLISTDPAKLDLNAIHGFLSKSYWETQGISGDTVEHSIRGSLCFGVYDGDQQVGFARVISDGATFAFLCDDYIVESHRGRGLGKWLMQCIFSHPNIQGLHRWVVVTRDTRLYEKFGFTALKDPGTYLEMVRPFAGEAESRTAAV